MWSVSNQISIQSDQVLPQTQSWIEVWTLTLTLQEIEGRVQSFSGQSYKQASKLTLKHVFFAIIIPPVHTAFKKNFIMTLSFNVGVLKHFLCQVSFTCKFLFYLCFMQ